MQLISSVIKKMTATRILLYWLQPTREALERASNDNNTAKLINDPVNIVPQKAKFFGTPC